MNIYKKNPIKYMGNLLGIQLRPDRFNIAKRVDDQYFDHKKSYEEQLDEIEKVNLSEQCFTFSLLIPFSSF